MKFQRKQSWDSVHPTFFWRLQKWPESVKRHQRASTPARQHASIIYDEHLDIGSGHGELIEILRTEELVKHSCACDYTADLMKLQDVKIQVADLNQQALPFDDRSFNLVTCTEVIEHLEHYRETIREMYRVLKPGGTLVLTTPNVLNLKSRVRFFVYGFHNLFGPLHIRESALHSTGGHINPVSYFYLAHSLLDAGFENITLDIDKKQGTSMFWLALFYLPIKAFAWLTTRKEKSKYRTIDQHNEHHVKQINSLATLTGRTIIVGCHKP
ncbi:MAG: class I SAM-dependent methyltransferase [Rhodoferax sp.]|nr:class I SAM-dependent methyltransferase [Rhodoferax sp.]MDP2677812.1 class I SAM-dependent methyltransferase [Rhodoferax sp.]